MKLVVRLKQKIDFLPGFVVQIKYYFRNKMPIPKVGDIVFTVVSSSRGYNMKLQCIETNSSCHLCLSCFVVIENYKNQPVEETCSRPRGPAPFFFHGEATEVCFGCKNSKGLSLTRVAGEIVYVCSKCLYLLDPKGKQAVSGLVKLSRSSVTEAPKFCVIDLTS